MEPKCLVLTSGTPVLLRFIDNASGHFIGKGTSIILYIPLIVEKRYVCISNDIPGYKFCVFSIQQKCILDTVKDKGDDRLFFYARNEDWKKAP